MLGGGALVRVHPLLDYLYISVQRSVKLGQQNSLQSLSYSCTLNGRFISLAVFFTVDFRFHETIRQNSESESRRRAKGDFKQARLQYRHYRPAGHLTDADRSAYWLLGRLTSRQHAECISGTDLLSKGNVGTEVVHKTCYPTQSLCIDTGPTRSCTDPVLPGAWQGSHQRTIFSTLS